MSICELHSGGGIFCSSLTPSPLCRVIGESLSLESYETSDLMGSSLLIFRISPLQGFHKGGRVDLPLKKTRTHTLQHEYIGVINEILLNNFICNFSFLLYILSYVSLFCILIDAPVYSGTRIPLCHTRLSGFWEGPDLNAAYSLFRFLRKGR